MNYFELFDIPVQLKVDTKNLKAKFYALSKQFHPDIAGNSIESQEEALEKSALINKAWKTFQSPDETIKYVLQQKGLLEEEEKYELPPAFLMEMLEVNEQLMEADEEGVKDEIEILLNNLENDMYEPVKKVLEHYQEGATTQEELLQVKEYYYKKKYLDRIRFQLKGMP